MTHIFDFDNTLVYTDRANNDAYRRALALEGLACPAAEGRITRQTVRAAYPWLSEDRLAHIVRSKQRLFSRELTVPNAPLIERVRSLGRDRCLLWSSAGRDRLFSLLDYYGLRDCFFAVRLSGKRDVVRELEKLARDFSLNLQDLTVYEDTRMHIMALRARGIRVADMGCEPPKMPSNPAGFAGVGTVPLWRFVQKYAFQAV